MYLRAISKMGLFDISNKLVLLRIVSRFANNGFPDTRLNNTLNIVSRFNKQKLKIGKTISGNAKRIVRKIIALWTKHLSNDYKIDVAIIFLINDSRKQEILVRFARTALMKIIYYLNWFADITVRHLRFNALCTCSFIHIQNRLSLLDFRQTSINMSTISETRFDEEQQRSRLTSKGESR